MFGWFKPGRATRAIPEPLWQDVLERHPFLAERAGRDLPRLRELAGQFLASKEFHGAAGFDVSDEMAVAIAAQAVLPVLHLGLAWYDDFVGIVVHAGEVLAQRTVTDEDGVLTFRSRGRTAAPRCSPAKPWTAAPSCSAGRTWKPPATAPNRATTL